MYWFRKNKSGFISVFTLIIVSIIMTYMSYILKIHLSQKSYNDIRKSLKCKHDIYGRKRECILTRLSKYIKNNMDIKDNIFSEINEGNIKFEDVIVKCDSSSKEIYVYFPYKLDVLRCETYLCNIDVQSKIVKFKLDDIKYVHEVV